MKGVFVQSGMEYRLEVSGDEFFQGDAVPCRLAVKNHSGAKQEVTDLRLDLALGAIKEIREKKDDAFEPVGQAAVNLPWVLEPQQDQSLEWTFALDKNCAISDKSQSLYLLFGPFNAAPGQLPLQVKSSAYISFVLRTLETTFQFVLKSEKSSKGWVEARLKPPSAKRFMLIRELLLSFRFEENKLLLRYIFSGKKLDASAGGIGMKKSKTVIEQQFEEGRELLPGGYIKQEALDAAIEEALSQVGAVM